MNEIAKIVPEEARGIALTAKGQVVLRSVGEAAGFAQLMQSGGMLPPKVTAASAVVAIVAGAGLGLNPFESVQSIAVINNRPSIYGDGMKAVVQGSGLLESEDVKWYKGPDGRRVAVQVTVRRKGMSAPIVGEFSENMARKAGLWGKQGPWQQYPERMMLARARAFAYRDAFADVLKGVRSAEEETDIIEAEAIDVQRPAEAPQRKRLARRATAAEIVGKSEAAPAALPAPEEPVDVPDAALSPLAEAVAAGSDAQAEPQAAEQGGDFLL